MKLLSFFKQRNFDKKLKAFNERHPDYAGFCDDGDIISYYGYLGADNRWIEGAEEDCKLFSKWFKEKRGLVIPPETIYQLWSFHSNDWDAQYLFMNNTEDEFRRQAKNIFRALNK